MLGLLAVFAQLEAEQVSERTRAGLAAAAARGRHGGRPRALPPALEKDIARKLAEGAGTETLARDYSVDPATIRRIRRRYAVAT